MFGRHSIYKNCLAVLLTAWLGLASAWAQGKTELVWYGHSAFKVTTPQGHVLWLDPWLTNPLNPNGEKDLDAVKQGDLILVSHGHFDHVGNAVEIAKQTPARLVTTFDLGNALATYGGFPKDRMGFDTMGNFGGTVHFFDNEVAITFIPAVHSSSVTEKSTEIPHAGGNPGGFLIQIKDGPTLYHTGDTDVFGDMQQIPAKHKVDIMLACIGDHFTMGPSGAAEAIRLVHPSVVIPMHYGTFPTVLTGNVDELKQALKAKGVKTQVTVPNIKQVLHY